MRFHVQPNSIILDAMVILLQVHIMYRFTLYHFENSLIIKDLFESSSWRCSELIVKIKDLGIKKMMNFGAIVFITTNRIQKNLTRICMTCKTLNPKKTCLNFFFFLHANSYFTPNHVYVLFQTKKVKFNLNVSVCHIVIMGVVIATNAWIIRVYNSHRFVRFRHWGLGMISEFYASLSPH